MFEKKEKTTDFDRHIISEANFEQKEERRAIGWNQALKTK